jgi:hypothetical protein
MTPLELMRDWLVARLPQNAAVWLSGGIERVSSGIADRDLYLLMGQVSRHVSKAPLALTEQELQAVPASRPDWDPREWTLDQMARVYLLCASTSDGAQLSRRLDQLCNVADVGELVAFYRGLPLYSDQPRYAKRAAEGVRSNMRVVFESVAHNNPYPAEQFAESAWNQMVLKALFIGSRLAPIIGLDSRRNATLANMLRDYAHERWAASRRVSPELWRCVGPFAAGPVLDDFVRLFERGTAEEQQAAAFALREATDPEAARLLLLHSPVIEYEGNSKQFWQQLAGVRG